MVAALTGHQVKLILKKETKALNENVKKNTKNIKKYKNPTSQNGQVFLVFHFKNAAGFVKFLLKAYLEYPYL